MLLRHHHHHHRDKRQHQKKVRGLSYIDGYYLEYIITYR